MVETSCPGTSVDFCGVIYTMRLPSEFRAEIRWGLDSGMGEAGLRPAGVSTTLRKLARWPGGGCPPTRVSRVPTTATREATHCLYSPEW